MYCLVTYFRKDGDVEIDEMNLSYEQACGRFTKCGDMSNLKTKGYAIIREDFMNDMVTAVFDVDFEKTDMSVGIFALVKSRLRDDKINKILEPEDRSWLDWLKKFKL